MPAKTNEEIVKFLRARFSPPVSFRCGSSLLRCTTIN